MTDMFDIARRAIEAQGKYDADELLARAQAEDTGNPPPGDVEPAAPVEQDQLPIFDPAASERGREAGMARVANAADPDWMTLAREALDRVIERGELFTADDVWAEVGSYPRERRALGPLLRRAADEGRIRNTGMRRNSARPEHHAYPCTVWRPVIE